MQNDLKVFFIQTPFRELRSVLKQIGDGVNIIYSNCVCNLDVGDENIFLSQFDTFLYNEDSSILIMLKCDDSVSKEDIIYWLQRNGKHCVDVIFGVMDDEEKENGVQQICISRDVDTLECFLRDSVAQGITSCDYYPSLNCQLQLCYLGDDEEQITLSVYATLDVIRLGDKDIIISNSLNKVDESSVQQDVCDRDILSTIMRSGLSCKKKFSNDSIVNAKKRVIKPKE